MKISRTKDPQKGAAAKCCENTQFPLSSEPRYFDMFWSVKLKTRHCTSAMNIFCLSEVLEL